MTDPMKASIAPDVGIALLAEAAKNNDMAQICWPIHSA